MRKSVFFTVAALAFGTLSAATINIKGSGAEQYLVSIDVKGDPAFAQTLKRNLELSGAFRVVPGAPIKVTGTVGAAVTAEGPAGGMNRCLTLPSRATDAKSARTEARQLADRMCESFAKQKGFANDRIAFVMKNGKSEELCVGYADGADMRQLTQDKKASVGPRWKNSSTIYYTGYLNNAPQIFEIDAETGKRRLAFGFGGLTTGATVSPDGSKAAIILSKPFGNPELCLINPASGTWSRLTKTPTASEGQPAWSPDGQKIVYVSNEDRHQHLYIIDAATKAKRRLTSSGSRNVDPDWGSDGRIVFTTGRGGQNQIAVISPAEGEASLRLVTAPGTWEHPTWARDRRHVIAERDGVLFLIDTLEQDDGSPVAPVKLFTLPAKCITPSWSR